VTPHSAVLSRYRWCWFVNKH